MAQKTSDLNRTDFDALAAGQTEDYRMKTSESRAISKTTSAPPEETEHLKAQIKETRKEMGETIDALQERLSFSNLSGQVSEHVSNAIESAKSTVYNATIGKAVGVMKNMGNGISDSGIVRTARDNPLPLVLIGLGAGLLVYNGFSGKRRRMSRQDRFVQNEFDQPREIDEMPTTFGSEPNNTTGFTDKVSDTASSAYESVSQTMNSAYSGTRDLANRAYQKAGEYGNYAYDTYDHHLHENPLVVGAAAFAVGALVGLAIPSTRYEGEFMGETRNELFRKAQDTGSQLLDKTKRIVDKAANTVSKESQAIIH